MNDQSKITKHIKLLLNYLITTNFLTLILVPVTVTILAELSRRRRISGDYLAAAGFAAAAISPAIYLMTRPKPVYLVDFACFKAPPHLKASTAKFLNHSRLAGKFDEAAMEFQTKILARSGLGDETYLPEGVHCVPADLSMVNARAEAESVVFGAVDALLAGNPYVVAARDIGIVVVNCSLFAPTPSLSATIVNRYKLRSDVRTFNLAGMGCSAGVISIDLAKDLLRVTPHKETLALVISTENITQNWYFGNDKSMLLPNCLFRVGGAALLLSRQSSAAKYKLLHSVRTHRGGSDNDSFSCVVQRQDISGQTGVSLSKDLMSVASRALRQNITTLGPLVLPVTQQLRFAAARVAGARPYVPKFGRAFEHFCVHAGGRAVIEELERSLKLSKDQTEASRMTLHRFGNTSSSSIWYELAYVEAKRRVKRGDRVWQIAFGSGFKCNSAVWEAVRDVEPTSGNPWNDCVRDYPVTVVHR